MCDIAMNYNAAANNDNGTCVIMSGGCSDPSALNYSGDACAGATYVAEDCQLEPLTIGPMDYTVTDGNMIIQVNADVMLLNGSQAPAGATLGVYYTSEATNELLCGGNATLSDDETQYAIAAWKAEGSDNGFDAGESFTWVLQVGNDFLLADEAVMNTAGIFTDVFENNGFGQLLSVSFQEM